MRRSGYACARAAVRARFSNTAVTTTAAGIPSRSHTIVSWTLHDVHDPHVPRPTTAASTARAKSATFPLSASGVPTRVSGSKRTTSRTPRRSRARQASSSAYCWKERQAWSTLRPSRLPRSVGRRRDSGRASPGPSATGERIVIVSMAAFLPPRPSGGQAWRRGVPPAERRSLRRGLEWPTVSVQERSRGRGDDLLRRRHAEGSLLAQVHGLRAELGGDEHG